MIPCSQLSLTRAEGPGHSLVWAGVTSWYLTTRAGWCFLTLRNLFVSPTIHPSIPNYQHNNILMLTTLILFFIAYKIFCDFYPLLFSGIVIFRISEEFKLTMNVTRGLRAGDKIWLCWGTPSCDDNGGIWLRCDITGVYEDVAGVGSAGAESWHSSGDWYQTLPSSHHAPCAPSCLHCTVGNQADRIYNCIQAYFDYFDYSIAF